MTSDQASRVRFLAEWERQDAVLIAWPHAATDWNDTLDSVVTCYAAIARAIVADEHLIIVTPVADDACRQLTHEFPDRITLVNASTNDTWARDFGPLTVLCGDTLHALDFTFNAWGMKFAANYDNLVTEQLASQGILACPVDCHRDMVLEGGSVESDGRGTLLTTTRCLLERNRNPQWSKDEIERQLMARLGARKVLWLDHGDIPGDDTDGHIDTLARLAPGNTIIHVTAREGDAEYNECQRMVEQLRTMTDADGQPFRLVALPAPTPVVDADGNRLPATYANYLVTNHQVLVPAYGQPDNDRRAIDTIASVFTDRHVRGIDCRPLIEQHGSLHCVTMQLPHHTLNR